MTRHWTYREEKQRKAILQRDNYECQLRLAGCLGIADTVDHIHPKILGGLAIPSNLQAACGPCNKAKGARAVAPSRHGFLNSPSHRSGIL